MLLKSSKSIFRPYKSLVSYNMRFLSREANITPELKQHLATLGVVNPNIVHNPSVSELYEYAMSDDHKVSFDPLVHETQITDTGALSVSSGFRTGRSPSDKRIVKDDITKDEVWWGEINIPQAPEGFESNRERAVDYMNLKKRIFVMDGYAGWDPKYRIKTRVISIRPYHALFMKQMLMRASPEQLNHDFADNGPDFTVINSGEMAANSYTADVDSKTSVTVNFTSKEAVILGTQYAGEMKKGIFGVMNFMMPFKGCLPMHASANAGEKDTTILFGLSGTGKTTLSADPKRNLIGDDEHVWTNDGIFNIEGGCYAKCVGLSRDKEPEIFDAIKFGAIVENINFHPGTRTINYDDTAKTLNTRVCYPLEHIDGCRIPAIGDHPKNIIFLTCDANGVLPPVAKLNSDQIMYHFMSGYTAKVAGTEMGIKEPIPSFSACFGEAFMPLHPYRYAKMLAEKVQRHDANVWLMNTGWTGGKQGVGQRMSLKDTRALIDAIHDGSLQKQKFQKMPGFNLEVPMQSKDVDSNIFMPIKTWEDKDEYNRVANKLAKQFQQNFKKYHEGTPQTVIEKGGPQSDIDYQKF